MSATAEEQRVLLASRKEFALWFSCITCDALPGEECRGLGCGPGEMHRDRVRMARELDQLEDGAS
jgi:hypothetical protein